MGTAGGIYQFRDQLLSGSPDLLFVMNGDICCDLPLDEMLEFHSRLGSGDRFLLMGTEVNVYLFFNRLFVPRQFHLSGQYLVIRDEQHTSNVCVCVLFYPTYSYKTDDLPVEIVSFRCMSFD